MFGSVRVTAAERSETRCGDELVTPADVVMDRAFTVPGDPNDVWPWIVQLGKKRAGWYLTRQVERLVPSRMRASRAVEPLWQSLAIGQVVPDYGGRDATFTVAGLRPPNALAYITRRRGTSASWSITLRAEEDQHTPATATRTRVLLRLRAAPVRHNRLARAIGGCIDQVTVAGLAAGLRERLTDAMNVPGAGG